MKLKTNIGVYILWSDEKVVYIGKSIDIYTRMYQSIKERENEDTKIDQYSIVETGSNFEACALEKMLIIENKPILNKEQYENCFCNVIKCDVDINSLERFGIEEPLIKNIEKEKISKEIQEKMYYYKNEPYEYKIESFMIEQLKLSGNELVIFAFLYSATLNGKEKFVSSINLISSITNTSEKTIKRALSKFQKKGLISKKTANFHNGECFANHIFIRMLINDYFNRKGE